MMTTCKIGPATIVYGPSSGKLQITVQKSLSSATIQLGKADAETLANGVGLFLPMLLGTGPIAAEASAFVQGCKKVIATL